MIIVESYFLTNNPKIYWHTAVYSPNFYISETFSPFTPLQQFLSLFKGEKWGHGEAWARIWLDIVRSNLICFFLFETHSNMNKLDEI